ncbi:MAG: hypothetical protein NT123_22110 [Proteobacteria bacterium]|nr:hypothetical protein [Pseudomonadota bacterium]
MYDAGEKAKPFNWAKFQQNMGYSDREMEGFKADPRRRKAAEALGQANRKTIVAEVVASHGCAAGLKCGDTFEVSAAGVVKSSNVCNYAVAPMTIHAAMAHDRIAEGLDPDGMWFNRFSCQAAQDLAGFSLNRTGRSRVHAS